MGRGEVTTRRVATLAIAVTVLLAGNAAVLASSGAVAPVVMHPIARAAVVTDAGDAPEVSEPPAAVETAAAPPALPDLVPALPAPLTETPAAVGPPAVEGPQQVAATAPSFPSPIRGVWVHVLDDTLLTRAGIARVLDDVAAAGGNTVVVEVARRYDAYHASAFLPRAADPGFEPGLDVLAEVSAGARARGLSVHAWFTAMPAWSPETAKVPEPVNWTYAAHGIVAPEADRWLTRSETGEWGDYLDPGHPLVADLVVATAVELAAYDIDAVHVDYLRYPGPEWGYNPVALARFQADTGRVDVPASTDPQWSDWRRLQTTQIARRMRAAVQEVNPAVGVSAALIAWGDGPVEGRGFETTPAWNRVFQPWPQWMAEGIVDVAMPMLYFGESRHAAFHRNWMSYVAGVRAATGVLTAPGQGSWLNAVDQSITQLSAAAPFVDGEVLFSYQETASGQGPEALLGALRTSLWSATPAS